MKIQLWTLMLPVSLTIFPGTPLEQIFGISHRPFSGTEEGSFHSGYSRLAPNADGPLATIPDCRNLLPTSDGFPADNEVTSQYANELPQPSNAYLSNQAGYGLDRIVPLLPHQGEELLHVDTGSRRIGLTDAENGPPIAPQSWSYGQHFESYALPMEPGYHFEPHALPMEHHTNHEFVTYLPQHDNRHFSHVENPIVENFLDDHLLDMNHESFSNFMRFNREVDSNQAQLINLRETKTSEGLTNAQNENPIVDNFLDDHLLDINHEQFSNLIGFSPEFNFNQAQSINLKEAKTPEGHDNAREVLQNQIIDNFLDDYLLDINPESFSNLLAFSPEFDSNHAQLINLGETETSEGLTNAQDVPLNTGGKRKAPEPPARFENSDYPALQYCNQMAKFIQDDHCEISHQFNSDPVEIISEKEAIQDHSKDIENIDFSKEMRSTHNPFHHEKSTISPESTPAPPYFQFLQVVEFKPSSIDGDTMIEAINGLKLPDGRKFVNIFFENMDVEKQLMIVKNPSRGKAHLLSKKYQELYRSAQVKIYQAAQEGGTSLTSNKARSHFTRSNKLKQATQEWKIFFNPRMNSEKQMKIEQYKRFVMKDIEQEQKFSKLNLQVQVKFSRSKSEIRKRLKYLKRVERVLPAFFFYVDLITTILPNEDLKNGALLKTTRKNAEKIILKLLEEKLLQPKLPMSDSELTDDAFESMAERKVFETVDRRVDHHVARETCFNWKLVYYWMLKSRKDLLDEGGSFGQQSNEFKGFFNDFFTSWNSITID